MDTREEATAFLHRMAEANPTDHLNRSFWPDDERAAYERWEESELRRKAVFAKQYGLTSHEAETLTAPLPATPPTPVPPGRKRGGR